MEFGLLTIPVDVFHDHLFPFLKFNDLLRLRRVSKQMKIVSDSSIRNNCIDQEIELNENDRSIENFIRMNLPASAIYINNHSSGLQFFHNPALPTFLQFNAVTVTRLEIEMFYVCRSNAERSFYSGLPNLEHLKIYNSVIEDPRQESKYQFPITFPNLKTLKMRNVKCISDFHSLKSHILSLLESCPKLEFLRLPLHNLEETNAEALEWVSAYLTKREHEFPGNLNLKVCDLLYQFQGPPRQRYPPLEHFLQLCHELQIKVRNLVPDVIDELCKVGEINGDEENNARDASPSCYTATILSLINIRCSMFALEMPAMEKLVIARTSDCSFGRVWSGENNIPKWPSLKTLKVTIDSSLLEIVYWNQEDIHMNSTIEFLKFLFGSVQRESLKELIISFDTDREGDTLPCPRAQDIIQKCGNITKLYLVNWVGTNKAVAQLWAGLAHLEDVQLDSCPKLGNVAFVGENKGDPTFLKLKKLRKFGLGGLEVMPKITDLVFELVFRHLKLKQFCLRSNEPISSITIKGILSLLTGEFNNHVDMLRFHELSLENVSEEEFSILELKFRASHMH